MQPSFRRLVERRRRGVACYRALIPALVCVAGGACTEIAGPGSAASVDVRVSAVVQTELSLLTDFTVDADITNTGSATILYDRWCNWRIEQLVNGSWAPAYTPLCSAEGREIYQLWIGEHAIHRYPAHRSWRVGNGAQIAGMYRLRMSVFSGEPGTPLTNLRETVVVSNSFTVR